MDQQRSRPLETAPANPFASHGVRLSGRQWAGIACVLVAAVVLVPAAWPAVERFGPGPDYRVPYALSADYWLFGRYCRWAARQSGTPFLGDSVIWGGYVEPDQTLPHYLGELSGRRFLNMGVDGLHPAAMAGLVSYYAGALRDMDVVVHCNPLWMSSPRYDLQTERASAFNHPRLVPQFLPRIPSYHAPWSDRIDVVIGRSLPFFGWLDHLRLAYFDQMDIAAWTLEHPYANPFVAPTRGLPEGQGPGEHDARAWTERGLTQQDFPWVELDRSFQWGSFGQVLDVLQERGNRVFVLVGPLNEHMLTPDSRAAYQKLRDGICARLRERVVAYCAPAVLPSELYADTSHPLAGGYALLAREVLAGLQSARFPARARSEPAQ